MFHKWIVKTYDNMQHQTALWLPIDFLATPQSFNSWTPSRKWAPPHATLLVTDHLQADPLNLLLSPCFREGQSPNVAVRTGDI